MNHAKSCSSTMRCSRSHCGFSSESSCGLAVVLAVYNCRAAHLPLFGTLHVYRQASSLAGNPIHHHTTMLRTAFLCGALALIVALRSQSGFRLGDLVALVQPSSLSADNSYKVTCQNLAKSISSASQVFYPRKCRCNSALDCHG